mgnify:CR=1 FL=1
MQTDDSRGVVELYHTVGVKDMLCQPCAAVKALCDVGLVVT